MKAAILGIGTELMDGQITNKNASWISKKLKDLGLTTQVQLAVPDERTLMREGLEYCAARADLVFVTGGLGPTSDDFTRDIVTEWAGLPLKFDEGSWQHIQDRLTSRGYTVKEIQRQQCFFPEGAEVLHNSQGTANGFSLKAHSKKVFVLPGPPREIEAIWMDSIAAWLKENTRHLDPFITRSWDSIAVGESDIAQLTEEVLKGVNVERGYRVHLPYVEVKLSYFKSQEAEMAGPVQRLTEALAPWTVARDGADAATLFASKLADVASTCVTDEVTGQFLMNRLMPVMRNFMTKKNWAFTSTRKNQMPAELRLWIFSKDEHTCEVGLEYKGRLVRDFVESNYKTANMRERRLQYFAEMAILFWLKNLP